MPKEPKREFVTSSGKVIHLQPVAHRLLTDTQTEVEREFVGAGEPVEPPKYEAPTIGGGSESFYHDEESIKTATNEEKEAWIKHQECLQRLGVAQNERGTVVAIIEGVLDEPTDDWLARMAYYKVELPENPYDLKVRYVTYDLLRTLADTAAFSAATMLLCVGMEVDQAAIDAALESFRDSIRGRTGTLLNTLAETLAGQRGLDVQSGVPEGTSSGESGQVDDGIRSDEQG